MLIKLTKLFHVSADYLLGIDNDITKSLDISDLKNEDVRLLEYTADVLRKKNEKMQTD